MTVPQQTLVGYLARQGAPVPPLTLVDVGCSGGIHPRWREWGSSLTGVGVDVMQAEIKRLASEEVLDVRYVCARMASGHEPMPPAEDAPSDYALHRSQAYVTTMFLGDGPPRTYEQHLGLARDLPPDRRPREANYSNVRDRDTDPFFRYYAQRFAGGTDTHIADRTLTLDDLLGELAAGGDIGDVDVLKVDVDGWELDVLRGARRTLDAGILAVEVEVQFTGLRGPDASVFSNVDAILRSAGLTLVDLQPARYARAALPQPFLYDIPAQNSRGAMVWGDALYMRDLLSDGPTCSPAMHEHARRLACIADAYGFHDWAAELVLACPGMFAPVHDAQVLDHLAAASTGNAISYAQLLTEFGRDPLGYGRPS